MDEQLGTFFDNFNRITALAAEHAPLEKRGNALLDTLTGFLGSPAQDLPAVSEEIVISRYVDADIVSGLISGRDPDARIVGVGGGQQRQHASFVDLIQHSIMYQALPAGQPDYVNLGTGPGTHRQVLAFGIRLFAYDGAPLAVLQRTASPQFGMNAAGIEVITPHPEAAAAFLTEVREYLRANSVIKGQVVSFTHNEYGSAGAGVTFHERPVMSEQDVVLPPGVLDRITEHAVGIARHRDLLLAQGQHLKRGLLLYGPPGTGKTHTARYLLGRSAGTTAILLSGGSLAYISEAARMARAMAPSIVVLEDVDLIAEDRNYGHGPQPLLFEVLDALDGLADDADVAFLLTTNRADMLETALAQRPGRVDLAVEIPLPNEENRLALLRLYAPDATFSEEAVAEAAASTEGTTASFARELARRAVLTAAVAGEPTADAHLRAAVAAMMSEGEGLTRSLLGSSGADNPGGRQHDGHPDHPMGYEGSYRSSITFGP